jgi:hypothetical protein
MSRCAERGIGLRELRLSVNVVVDGRGRPSLHRLVALISYYFLAGFILFEFAFEGMLGAVARLWEIAIGAIL